MHLSGQLTDWSINDLLQIMQVTKKTGSLDIEGDRRGRVHFRDGAVTGAELTGVKGSYLGSDRRGVADVLYVLSTLTTGSFAVGPADGPDTTGWGVEDVLSDVEALRSLEGEVIDAGLFEAVGVRFVQEIKEPITIMPKDWSVLVSLVQPFAFSHLEDSMGRGGAVRVFHTLHRLGVAEAIVDDSDESEWLDKLAEDISPVVDDSALVAQVDDDEEEAVVAHVAHLEAASARKVVEIPTNSVRGVSAPASTTLTDGVYDEIRRLRSKVAEQ
jgi:hypothetical protein